MAYTPQQLAAMTHEELVAALLVKDAPRKANEVGYKPSTRGCVQITGGGRFPLSPYPEFLVRAVCKLTGFEVADLRDMPLGRFLIDNRANLSFKTGIPEMDIPADSPEKTARFELAALEAKARYAE